MHPILEYPNPNRPYVLFTDASKYAWAGVLTQPHDEIDKSKSVNCQCKHITEEDSLSPCILHQWTL